MSRRILYVNTPTYIGGAEISLLTLMKNLSADRYVPYLLTGGDGLLLRQAQEMNIPVFVQKFPWFSRRMPWQYLLSIYRLVRTIRALHIDIIHTNCDHSLRYVMYASKVTRIPYLSHVRDFVRTWFDPDKVVAMNHAQHVISNSYAVAEVCRQAGIEMKRIVTIYNPVDIDKFVETPPSAGTRLRAELNIPDDALVVGIVGQIQLIKGHQEFIEAGLRLVDRIPDVHFLIVGNVPSDDSNELFFNNLKTRITNSKYTNRFHFISFRSDIPVVMKAIDILAVPSHREPFGRVAVEGLASGCAVVGTNVGGLPEIISDKADGLLTTPKDSEALFTAIYQLAVNPKLRQQLSDAGIGTAKKFTIANHIERVQALYEGVFSPQ